MTNFLLFLILVCLFTIIYQLGLLLNGTDLTKEDELIKTESKKVSEAKKRIPKP